MKFLHSTKNKRMEYHEHALELIDTLSAPLSYGVLGNVGQRTIDAWELSKKFYST